MVFTRMRFRHFRMLTGLEEIDCQVIAGMSFPVAAIFDEKVKLEVAREWLK